MIPKWEAIYRLRAKNWVDSRLNTLKNTNFFLPIYYEDLLESQNETASIGMRFLKCPPTLLKMNERRLYRQSKGNTYDYISNYKELVGTLSKLDLLEGKINIVARLYK